MPVFGLVTEGGTDQALIRNILNGLALRVIGDELDWSVAQPEMTAGKQTGAGGWERVFEFLANRELLTDILLRADCLVIHLDTDCAEHANFGVALHSGGARRSTADIMADVRAAIESSIDEDVLKTFGQKLLFAIAVNSIECWLLPLYGKKRSVANEQNCERIVAVELRSKGQADRYVIRKKDQLIKDYGLYLELGADYYEKVDVRSVSSSNESLEAFIVAATLILQGAMPAPHVDPQEDELAEFGSNQGGSADQVVTDGESSA